jgi:hypothetical protein
MLVLSPYLYFCTSKASKLSTVSGMTLRCYEEPPILYIHTHQKASKLSTVSVMTLRAICRYTHIYASKASAVCDAACNRAATELQQSCNGDIYIHTHTYTSKASAVCDAAYIHTLRVSQLTSKAK